MLRPDAHIVEHDDYVVLGDDSAHVTPGRELSHEARSEAEPPTCSVVWVRALPTMRLTSWTVLAAAVAIPAAGCDERAV